MGNTTLLLLSEDGDTLFVGARDAVISLDVSQEGAMGIRSQVGAILHKDLRPSTQSPIRGSHSGVCSMIFCSYSFFFK